MVVQNLAVHKGQWLCFLCCYVVCEMEKTIFPLPRWKFILNSIKNVHVPMKPQRVISATRGLSTLLRTIFELFFQEFCYETYRLIQKRWESAKKFQKVSFLRSQIKPCFFSKCFSNYSVKTRWWNFSCSASCRVFLIQKCLGILLRKSFAHKSFIQRANNASWLISYFGVLLQALRPFCVF